MKNFYQAPWLFAALLLATISVQAQTATATYSAGSISTELNGNATSSTVSGCSADLTVTVPAGQFVTSVDIEYDMTAIGGAWLTEQLAYVECVTTGTAEASITNGPPVFSGGTQSYNRTNLNFANGIVPAGGALVFRIHAFRSWGGFGCSVTNQFIPNNTYKVTVNYSSPPTCPQPTNVAVTNITANSLDLSWVSGGATNWQIEYWPLSSPASTTLLGVSTNPFTISGLNPSITYQVRMRDSCGLGDVSFWTAFQTVKTSCSTISAPWTETFDGPDWLVGGFGNIGSIDTCFTRNGAGNITFETGPPAFLSFNTGPNADHTTGSGKFVFSDVNSFTSFPDSALLETPSIDLSPLTIPEFSFWYHMFGSNIGELKVQVSTNGGTTYNTVQSIVGQQQTSKSDLWNEAIVNLSAYANTTVVLRFVAIQTSFGANSEIALDDLDMHEQPSCPKPSLPQVISQSSSDITLDWTTGGATSWEIEYGAPGFTLGTGTLITATSNPFTISGLSSSTNYEFYIRDVCAPSDKSAWSVSVEGTTLCAAINAPYLQTFDGSSFNRGNFNNDLGTIDNCWTRDVSGNFFYKTGPSFFSFGSGALNDHTLGTAAGKYVYSERTTFSGTSDTAEISSPLINLGPLTNPQLSFWYHMFGADIDRLLVLVSNDFGLTYTQVYSRIGQQQNSNIEAWKEAIVDLSAFASDTIIVRFLSVDQATGFASNLCIDDFNIEEQPTCPKPQDLVFVGATNNAVTLSWTSGGAANWNIEYGAPGFALGAGTQINVTTNPFTVTGLNPNTAYEFYVRDSCGAGDVSLWDGPVTDTTDCNPVSAPFLETFDGSAFSPGGFFAPGVIDPCWDRAYGLNYIWKPTTSITNFASGPLVDHTTGTGQFMNADRLFGPASLAASTTALLETPLIDLTPLTVPELTFWYHMFGPDIDSLVLDVFSNGNWIEEFVLDGQQQTAKGSAWKEAVVNLSAYANDTIKLRFRAVRTTVNAFSVNTSIDDVDIHEQPTCPKPANLAVTSAGANDITLSWTTGGAANWQVEYGAAGFALGTGTVVNATTNPFTVTGLNSATTYDFYVRDSCSATDLSDWLGVATASTNCLPILAPYTENFDGSQWLPGALFNDTGSIASCWARTPLTNYFWRPGPPPFISFATGPSADHTTGSGGYVFTETSFGGGSPPFDAFIETPPIDLSPLNVPELTFWYHMYGSGIGSLEVEIDNGSGFTSLQSWTGQQQTSGTDAWKEAIISLSAYANDTVVLRFKATKAGFSTLADAAVDDISIQEAPACPKPFSLSTIPSSTSISVSWTTGGATNWQIEYGPLGFAPGTGTIINTASNPANITGLTPNTPHDIYVRDSCSATEVSAWEGPITDTTLCSVFSAPFTENFDGSSWVEGPFIADPGSIDQCWNRTTTSGYYWKANQGGTQSFNTGPISDHTSGSGKYMFAESFGSFNDSTVLLSPLIDLSSLTNPQFRIWYHMYGISISEFNVWVFDGTSWTKINTVTGQQQLSESAPWVEIAASLSAFANDTVRFRMVAKRIGSGTLADIAIDDFWIGEAPSCARPSNITTSNPTTTSITLNWNTGGATNWLLGYRSGTAGPLTVVPVNTNPFVLNGLSPSTSYQFFMKDSCGVGDVSLWEGPVSGVTLCGIASAPWSESFDGSEWVEGTGATNLNNQISSCWSRPSPNNPNFGPNSGTTTSGSTGPISGATGTGKYLYTESSGGASGTGEITSPLIHIPASLVNPRMKFAYHMYGTGITSLAVEVSDGGAFTNVITITGQQQFASGAAWLYDSLDLSTYAGDTLQFRFKGTNTFFSGDIAIDEVSVISDPNLCADPTSLNFTNITAVTARANWTSTNSSSELEVVPLGQAQGTGDLYTGVTSPYDITSLQPASTYLIYVRDSCGSSIYSNWIVDTLTTSPCPVVTAGFTFATNVLNVNFNNGSTVNADSIYWDFGDGNNSSAINPSNLYGAAGTYAVSLLAFNICDIDTLVDTVIVCDTLLADFTSSQTGDTVILDAGSSQGATAYYWDLGDGNDTTGMLARHVYATAGSKQVTLTVVNDCGDSLTLQKTVKICLPPVADWTAQILGTGGNGMQVQFDATATQNATSYDWDFGDGNTATGVVQPIHTYVTPGLFYLVKLTVSNDCGDSNAKSFRLNQIGVDEYALSKVFEIYPNPAQDYVQLEWSDELNGSVEVELFDATGKLLLKQAYDAVAEATQIDVRNYESGVYSIRINFELGVITESILIR